jgi:hypothetical protein
LDAAASGAWRSGDWLRTRSTHDLLATAGFAILQASEPVKMARVLARSMDTALHELALHTSLTGDRELRSFIGEIPASIKKGYGRIQPEQSGLQHTVNQIVHDVAADGRVLPHLAREMHAASSTADHPNLQVGERVPHVDVHSSLCQGIAPPVTIALKVSALLNLSVLALAASGHSDECDLMARTTAAYVASVDAIAGYNYDADAPTTIGAAASGGTRRGRMSRFNI